MLKNLIKLKKANIESLNQNWLNWLNDKEVNKFSKKSNKIHTFISQKKYLSKIFKSKSKILFMVVYRNRDVGTMLISKISKKKSDCEISYMIGAKKLWNKNIGTKMIKSISNYIFENLHLKKINAGVREDNLPSQKILLKNGFKLKKVKKSDIKKNKKYLKSLFFQKVKNEDQR